MFCTKCGSRIEANERFCGSCGALNDAFDVQPVEPSVQDPQFEAQSAGFEMPNAGYTAEPAFEPKVAENVYSQYIPEQSVAPKKGISPVKIGLIALCAVVVIAAIVVGIFMSGIFDGDSAKLWKAFAKTSEAYSGIGEDLDLPNLTALVESQEYNQSVSFWVEELDEAPEAEGFGIRMDGATSIPDREMDMILTPFYGAVDLLDLELKFDDDAIYIGSPELTDDTYYKLNLGTLGDDLARLGISDEMAGFGFNVFEFSEIANSYNAALEDAHSVWEDAVEEFKDELEIKENGDKTIEVNGNDVDCTAYEIVITGKAVGIAIDGLEEYMNSVDVTEIAVNLFESMGFPNDMIDEMKAELAGTDIYGEMFDSLRYVVEDMDDVTLDVYVSDGYVMAIVWEGEFEGEDIVISVNLGGGDNYIDDLSICIEADGSEMVLSSSGNHTGDGGEFTDETKLMFDGVTMLASNFSYNEDSDDLFWEIKIDEVSIYLEGQLSTEKEGLTLRLDEIGVTENGESLGVVLGFEYSIGSYEGSSIEIGDSVNLLEMSEADLEAAGTEIGMNAYMWLMGLAEEIPELQGMLGEFMG